jgi:ribosomal protein S18 acetylase RimI-like enzyme
LTAGLLEDFLYFFDYIAFSDNPAWAGCYCHYYHNPCNQREWQRRRGEENRNASKELILSGRMSGYLAFMSDRPIGWCNVNRKSNFARLMTERELRFSDDDKVASIVCFIVAPQYRKQGVAWRLLKEACSGFITEECDYIEAYPRKDMLSDAQHYHGPFSMYIKEGFASYKNCNEYTIVRKKLRGRT